MPSSSSSSSPSPASEKKHWWFTNRKIVDKYVKDARSLASKQDASDVSEALGLIDAALLISPCLEAALELKARCLLFLRRFRDVADMLQDYIPSYRAASISGEDDSSTSLGSNSSAGAPDGSAARERAKLLPGGGERSDDGDRSFRCFSVSDLKKKVMAGLSRGCSKEGQWRYLVLGQACCHLGLLEDAMVLLQTGRRLAMAERRRESVSLSDDSFALSSSIAPPPPSSPPPLSESESASHLLAHIKLLLRRRAAAAAALDAGLPAESVRHFSKILDGRRGTPASFAAACLVGRASAYLAAGRLAESVADCNRALALDQSSIPALRARADALEASGAIPDALRDLDHLKLLYDAVLKNRKLPGPAWRPHGGVRYRDIQGALRALTQRIQSLRQRVGSGVDYHALFGLRRNCGRSELERAHLLLALRHKPDRASAFIDRLEFCGDEYRDLDAVRDQARMSALILYRMIQKGYASIMVAVMDDEAVEKRRLKEAAAAAAMKAKAVVADKVAAVAEKGMVFQGVFCRDLAAVGSLISQAGFSRPIPVAYEALSC